MPKFLSNFLFIFISLLFNCCFLSSAYGKINNLSLTNLSVAEGLSQGTIHALLQDRSGFIWLGTESGLNVYDGNKFRQLPGPDNIFADAGIYNLIEDRQGLIWITVNGKRLYTYDPRTNKYQLIPSKTPENKEYYIGDVVEADDNGVWVLMSKSLGYFDKNKGVFKTVVDFKNELKEQDRFYKMAVHGDNLYLGSKVGVFVFNINKNKWRKLPALTHNSVLSKAFNPEKSQKAYTLYAGKNNNLYIGTMDGIFTLNINKIDDYIEQRSQLPNYKLLIKDIAAWSFYTEKQKLYLTSNNGLYHINELKNSASYLFSFSDYFDDITNNNIPSIIKSTDGVFWLGSSANGVYQWNPKREIIQNFRYQKDANDSLSYNETWGILPSSLNENMFWVGTSNGLNLVDLANNSVKQFVVNIDTKITYTESYIYDIKELNSSQLLISTPEGVRIFDLNQEKYMPLSFSKEINQILAKEQFNISLDDNYLWVDNRKGYYRIDLKHHNIDYLDEINLVFPEGGLKFLGKLTGSHWFLFASNDGIWGLDLDSREFRQLYRHPDILKDEWLIIDNWVIDNHNILWLSYSAKGLLGLSLETFERKYFYHNANSIIDNNVYGLMKDEYGDIWFSTHDGIYMLNGETHHISRYGPGDGFAATEFNSSSYTKLKNGLFVYGSMEGVSIFDPQKLKHSKKSDNFSVKVTRVEILSRDVETPLVIDDNETISLNYDDVGIRVDFSTFSFLDKKNISFDFRLTGQSNIEYPPSNESHIIFPNLPSGSTTLEIRAKSPETGLYSKPVILNFQVSYAPWRSPYAYTFYLLVILVLILFWSRYRQAQRQLLLDIHEQVKYREKRLQLALTGSNSEVWDWQADDDLMFGKRIAMELGYINEVLFYKFNKHIDLIHPDDKDNFITLWQLFLANANLEDNFSCSYRLKTADGDWLWYKDLGKIVAVDSSGKPSRITGSYTNITESRANEERAQYYGDAFKQTQDWVLIIDEKISRVTANHSMRKVFGWHDEVFDFDANILGLEGQRHRFYKRLLLSLKEGQHWSGEELIITANKEEYHVVINISAAINSVTNNKHYICIFTDISAQKSAENELRFLANYDHLTGLPNRSLLLDRIKHAIDQSRRKDRSIALFFIDLDRFKQVNDSLGHDYGDLLLKEITKRLTFVLRVDDTVARIGGDEFVVLLESFTSNNQLGHIAQKIIETIGEPTQLNNNMVSVGASIGIALYPEDSTSSDELLRNADVAMYHAKQLGRNNFQFFTDEMNLEAKERLTQESKIKQAVKKNEFINHYQPIVNAHTGKAVGFELLMRWKSPEGIIPPDQFIPLSEELGLIIAMTESALDRGLRALSQWSEAREGLYLSVNIAPQHFAKESLVSYIERLLNAHKMPASSLRIEVTESAFISEPEKAIQTMCALSALGVTLALDDFGTGFSSLSYLKQLPLDIIKIDRSFVSGIGINKADEAIVDTTLVLAKRLNMHCIAEGVETKEQLNYLVTKNCHYIQGYFYAKPVPAQEIMKILMINETNIIVDSPF